MGEFFRGYRSYILDEKDEIGERLAEKYDFVEKFIDGLYCVRLEEKYALMDKDGKKEVFTLKYNFIMDDYYKEGFYRTFLDYDVLKNGNTTISKTKVGLIDKETLKEILPPKYNKIHQFNPSGFADVELNGYFGRINRNGEEIIEPKYYSPDYFFIEGIDKGELNDKCVFVDQNEKKTDRFKKGFSAVKWLH